MNFAEETIREELKNIGPFTYMKLNKLADLMYQLHGYNSQPDVDYLQSKHPEEQRMFQLALIANWFFKDDEEGEEE